MEISIRNPIALYLKRAIQKLGQVTVIVAIAGPLWLGGCSKRYNDLPPFLPLSVGDPINQSVGRFKSSYIVDQIDFFYRGTTNGPIGVTTMVNLDDLYSTSSFGRMFSEQMMSELSMRGFDVVELRHADALQFLADAGEFALSRDIGSVRRARDLSGVVVGTYVTSPERVYVNVRMVDPSTSLIVSSASAEMTKTRELARMLRGGSALPTLERIPVKHLGRAVYPLAYFPSRVVSTWDEEESGYGPPPQPLLRAPASGATRVSPAPHDGMSHGSEVGAGVGSGYGSGSGGEEPVLK